MKYKFIIYYTDDTFTTLVKYCPTEIDVPLKFQMYKPNILYVNLTTARYIWKLCNNHGKYIKHNTPTSNSLKIAKYKIIPITYYNA